jgi:archaellum biogenesis protein FlaJ (TadC family)
MSFTPPPTPPKVPRESFAYIDDRLNEKKNRFMARISDYPFFTSWNFFVIMASIIVTLVLQLVACSTYAKLSPEEKAVYDYRKTWMMYLSYAVIAIGAISAGAYVYTAFIRK